MSSTVSVYDLVGPIFLGTFLAIVTVVALMGKAKYLLIGPAMLFDRRWARHGKWHGKWHGKKHGTWHGKWHGKKHGGGKACARRGPRPAPCDGSRCGCSMCAEGKCACSRGGCRCAPTPRVEAIDDGYAPEHDPPTPGPKSFGPAPQATPWQPNVLPPAWRSTGLKTAAAPVFSSQQPFENRCHL